MKKIAAMLLCLVMVFSLAACGGQKETDPAPTEPEVREEVPEEATGEIAPAPAAPRDWREDDTLQILTVGNSFSDDTMQYVYKIAADLGVENIVLGNLYIAGCSLEMHHQNAKYDTSMYEYRLNTADEWVTTPGTKFSTALTSQDWDFISLQQVSGRSGIEQSYGHLEGLIEKVKELCPNATLCWNMTWAYQQNSTHTDFWLYGRSQQTMYDQIVSVVNSKIVPNADLTLISPTGTAIQNARTSYLGDTLTRDGYHLSKDVGRFIAGLTFFKALSGVSLDGLTFRPEGVDENVAKIAVEAANNAVAEPFAVTNSIYTEQPQG